MPQFPSHISLRPVDSVVMSVGSVVRERKIRETTAANRQHDLPNNLLILISGNTMPPVQCHARTRAQGRHRWPTQWYNQSIHIA